MKYYVDAKAEKGGDGSRERPFKRINDAAKVALPGDEVLVAPGIYREYVDPVHSGTEEARISYLSTTPLGAVITGAEQVRTWQPYKENVWVCGSQQCFRRLQSLYHFGLWRLVFRAPQQAHRLCFPERQGNV